MLREGVSVCVWGERKWQQMVAAETAHDEDGWRLYRFFWPDSYYTVICKTYSTVMQDYSYMECHVIDINRPKCRVYCYRLWWSQYVVLWSEGLSNSLHAADILVASMLTSQSFPSQVQTNAFTVMFDDHFSIPLVAAALDEYSLRFSAFGIDADERNISAGTAELKLSDLDLSIRPFNAWLYLQDMNKVTMSISWTLYWRTSEYNDISCLHNLNKNIMQVM